MFSGIVTNLEKPEEIQIAPTSRKLTFSNPKNWKIEKGDSISIDGICSTVESLNAGTFTVHYMEETLKKTNLLSVNENHLYNLEQPLTLNSFIGGHLVTGHIDTTSKVKEITVKKDSTVITFSLSSEFTQYIIYKGSITVNGVSLTIVTVSDNEFTVSLIPYTLIHTNLGSLKIGDFVNIEVDLLAKYLEKLNK